MKLSQIAEIIDVDLVGSDREISGINTLHNATPSEISFLSDKKYEKELPHTKAAAVILPSSKLHLLPADTVALCSDEPYLAVAMISKYFAPPICGSDIAPIIGEESTIYPTAHIENGTTIGANSTIMAGAYVGTNVKIGSNVIIYPNVSIYRDCIIGDNCIIHSGTVIGSDGFGFAHTKTGEHIKLYQNGNVVIEDDVEIGANTTVDCAVFGSTIIKRGTKIDNLVQIGHNCVVGEYSIMVSQSGLAGSTTLGRNVVMGGQSAASGHLEIAAFTTLAARSGVTKNITKAGVYSGFPLMEHKLWLRLQAKISKLLE